MEKLFALWCVWNEEGEAAFYRWSKAVCASIFGTKPGLHHLSMAPCDHHSKERQRSAREGVGDTRGRSTPDWALSPLPSRGGSVMVPRLLLVGYFAWINLS